MTVRALSITPRLKHVARCTLTSIVLCVSLLVSACGGGDSGSSSAGSVSSSASVPSPTSSNYTLAVSVSGSGTVTSSPSGINCGTNCSAGYVSDTSITLTATAATGYTFAGWGGACAGTSATCTVSMTVARNVTAAFSQNGASNYTLAVSVSGSGTVASSPSGINCGTSCNASYVSGSSVTLTATAATGYTFAGWGGACAGTSAACTLSMTATRNVTAAFSQNGASSFTLTVNKAGSGTVTSSPSGIDCGTSCSAGYVSGTSVTLTATAATGYTFAGWSGACTGTSATCTVLMTVARNVTATFSQNSVSNSTYVVSWDLVTDPNVTGYKLYYATAPFSSGPQFHTIDVGLVTSYEFTPSVLGLSASTTIYFAVTATGGGMESPLSSPVSGVIQ